jgi:hypothetical protein
LLSLPDFTKTLEIKCDASWIGIGAVLIQKKKASWLILAKHSIMHH